MKLTENVTTKVTVIETNIERRMIIRRTRTASTETEIGTTLIDTSDMSGATERRGMTEIKTDIAVTKEISTRGVGGLTLVTQAVEAVIQA